MWAATLISFGFSLPLLAEVLHHPFGSVWKKFAVRCRIYPPAALPMQMLNSAILSLTFVLPVCSLTYREHLPVGAQFRRYDMPACVALGLILLLLGLIAFAVHFFMNLDMELLRDAPFCIMLAAMVLAVGGGIIWIFRNIKYR